MKRLIILLLFAALPAFAYDLKIADAPTTATNETATATLPYVNVTQASQFALCITAHMEETQASGSTNLVWYPGSVTCTASNSIDTVTWFADPARSFAFNVATNGTYPLQTNFTDSMGAIGYEQYTVTVSNNVNLTWTSSVKPGF
jgi:hypothetical protein